ncbi:MAG: glycosyl hydrolase family 28-related protein [Limisphaerales bacterium]
MRKSLATQTIIAGCIISMTMLGLNAQAVVTATWNPAGTASDLWSDSASWSTGTVPDTNTFANISSAIPCVVDATAGTALCDHLNIADGAGSSGTLIVTNGGVLSPANDYCAIGYSGNGTFDVENGGSATFPIHLWIGFNTGATGTFIMNGGTVTVMGMFGEGWNGGVGTAHVNGGTLVLKQFSPTQSIGPGSLLDIAGGTIIISGNYASAVNNYIASGQITAYGGDGTVIVDYGTINPGDTTITASNTKGSSNSWPQVIIPSLNTNEIVVASATPQEFGAVADGVTDDSAAFQNAINAVYNSGGYGGGVVYVPPGNYAFYHNITIPTGVTLHGDWTDWTKGSNGLVGTTFCIYAGAGQPNGTPFITMGRSAALRDINFWYPNQNPSSITPYPYTISAIDNTVIQNVVLVNSYQGIQMGGAEFILSTVIGTPLFLGFSTTGGIADICMSEDIRFSPAIWPASLLPNAPTAGGAYATWMRANGTGMQVFHVDGLINTDTKISGYNIGIDFEMNGSGPPACAFYDGYVTNCATALLAQEMETAPGVEFSRFTLDGDVGVSGTHATNDAAVMFDNCQIIGRNGTAVTCIGADWQSSMAFQNCTISNALDLTGPSVFNLVNCRLLGNTQCVMNASATAAAFTGCTFSPSQNIINNGAANKLLIDPRPAISNAMPVVDWTNVMADFATRRPAKTNLFIATDWGAIGNGVTDDTVAIQNALAAAGTNGGGIVYLPPGDYHVTNTLDVPSGVELRGPYELRHHTWPGADNIAKGAILQPYGGQGTTNGPPAIALESNAGLVGLTISYESQWTNCFPFPPTIQGRGRNIYMIGIQCPNPYYYVDLDTYTCTNHFLDMVDGWALKTGVCVGNGSSGSIVDCHANWTFWIDNFASPHALQVADQSPVLGFVMTNLQYYVLGNCKELFVKDFSIIENMYMHCISEDGVGPTVTGISAMCDASYQCFVFDATGSCTFDDVNPEWLVSLNLGYPGLNNQAAVLTSSNFTGTVRFFNSPIWGGHNWDYIINGGDVTMELVHLWQYAFQGTQVNGGAFHLINCGAFNVVDGGSGYPAYNLNLGSNSGFAGKTNEVIGCFSYGGWSVSNENVTNPADIWMDYALSDYSVLNVGPVVIGNVYPDGLYQFEPSASLNFMMFSPNGINPSGITVSLTQTNLLGQGLANNYTTANGLTISGSAALSVSIPLVTNMMYKAVIQVADANGNKATNSLTFDTINPAFTFEAEDFDYNGGRAFVNPQPGAYAGLTGVGGIDYSNGIPGQGSASYRPQGLETEGAGDQPRLAYTGYNDYDIGFANVGNWANYSRMFPSGSYNIYARVANPNLPGSQAIGLAQVTSGRGTTTQATSSMGTFSVPNTGDWQTYVWTPLLDGNGQPFVFQGGSVETFRATQLKSGYNVNYYMLVSTNSQLIPPQGPVLLQVTAHPTANGQSLTVAWPGSVTDTATNLYWTPNLTPPITWTMATNAPVYTNGQWIVTLPTGTNSSRFYQLQH